MNTLFRHVSSEAEDIPFRSTQLFERAKGFYADANVREHFRLDRMTAAMCLSVGFSRWDDESDLLLFPLWYVPFVPEGVTVTDICGETYAYSRQNADLDTRFGCVGFGIHEHDLTRVVSDTPR